MIARFFLVSLAFSLGLFACEDSSQESLQHDVARETSPMDCPQAKWGESAEDCPWAGIARELVREDEASKSFAERLQAAAPDLLHGLQADLSDREALNVWGVSQNFEAAEKSAIVNAGIMRGLLQMARLPEPSGPNEVVVHAGLQHSYGYLLSNLKTGFGFKRQRWVRGDLEAGFRLTDGLLGPEPEDGGFLRNVSYFLARIAFRDHPEMQSKLELIQASEELKKYRFEDLNIKRVRETIKVTDSRTIRINCDLVKLPGNAVDPSIVQLLVYSYEDSSIPTPKLISGFPINQGTFDALTIPGRFGEKVLIKPRYNVFIPGVSDQKSKWIGKRELLFL